MTAHPEQGAAIPGFHLYVGNRGGVGAPARRVLGVIGHREFQPLAPQRVDEGVDGSVALAPQDPFGGVGPDDRGKVHAIAGRYTPMVHQLKGAALQILAGERRQNGRGRKLLAGAVRDLLDHAAELYLQASGQSVSAIPLEHIGHPPPCPTGC